MDRRPETIPAPQPPALHPPPSARPESADYGQFLKLLLFVIQSNVYNKLHDASYLSVIVLEAWSQMFSLWWKFEIIKTKVHQWIVFHSQCFHSLCIPLMQLLWAYFKNWYKHNRTCNTWKDLYLFLFFLIQTWYVKHQDKPYQYCRKYCNIWRPPDPSHNIITSVAEINMLRTWQTQIPDNT